MDKSGANILYPSECILGESPIWHSERQSCFWVDIENRIIHEYSLKDRIGIKYQLPHRISLIVEGKKKDELIVGLQGGVGRFNLITRNLSMITSNLNVDWQNYRCNDGGCDSMGRLWISTTELDHKECAGALYCINEDISIVEKMDNLTISNGMAWSIDNKKLFHTDSTTRKINSYRYEENSGRIEFEKTIIEIPSEIGLPDGLCIDVDGKLWVALWGGFGVGRFDVDTGEMISFLNIPAPHVSSCAFIGRNLDKLAVTTARKGMTREQLIDFPQSGHVFIADAGVAGVPVFNCHL